MERDPLPHGLAHAGHAAHACGGRAGAPGGGIFSFGRLGYDIMFLVGHASVYDGRASVYGGACFLCNQVGDYMIGGPCLASAHH